MLCKKIYLLKDPATEQRFVLRRRMSSENEERRLRSICDYAYYYYYVSSLSTVLLHTKLEKLAVKT